ncbi:MAG: ketose-bisphosphate aldolase [Acidimicrobiaceae bacterium]|nr:ketose-bisphosphate aldolase [Acidimicrobiaceae bacterium]
MPAVPLMDILKKAFDEHYGVAAFNVVNDLTMEAVLAAAQVSRAPVIVQTSVKTVRSIGSGVLFSMWEEMSKAVDVPVSLHLDHCPDRAVITECLQKGWNSVLFDGSQLSVVENLRQTTEVVHEARRYGAHVEGEIEAITGVEDGVGSDEDAAQQSLEVVLNFVRCSGIDVFAPAIGNAHGVYRSEPALDMQRVSDVVSATSIPIALHGGTGMAEAQFRGLIERGCAKINISTALKINFMQSSLAHLEKARFEGKWDPPSFFRDVRSSVMEMAAHHIQLFGSAGKA